MTLNFANDSEVIIYAFERIISFARQNQYFFVGSCVWWIASVIGLDTGLRIHIDSLEQIGEDRGKSSIPDRGISSIPRDIARDISVDSNTQEAIVPIDCITEPLRRTRKGRINPRPQSKRQLKKARQNRINQISKLSKKQLNRLRGIDTDTLTEYLLLRN